MRGMAVGVVTASKSAKFPVGSTATGSVGWTEVAVVKEKALQKIEVPRNGKLTDALGVLGKTYDPLVFLMPLCHFSAISNRLTVSKLPVPPIIFIFQSYSNIGSKL